MNNIQVLDENDFWRVSMIDGNTDVVTIAISSSPRIGQEFADEEFKPAATQDGKGIFIIDKTNSFGNSLDWDTIVEVISPHIDGKTVRAVGFCMGGTLAIILSKFIKIDSVVAITPQYSAAAEYFPEYGEEHNPYTWFNELYTDKIKTYHIRSLDGYFGESTQYYVFNSSFNLDQLMISYFPEQENITIFEFGEDYSHGLPGDLGRDLNILVTACWNHHPEVVTKFINDHYNNQW